MTTGPQATIQIRQYRPEDHAQVTKIYVEGMLTFDPNPEYHYLWKQVLIKDLTNDFADIEASHMTPGGNFLVAVVKKDGSSKIAGIIGLLRESEDVGQIRRVYVDPNFQRMSIGRKMIAELEIWAQQNGIKSIYLTTDAYKEQPQAFYTALGYTKVDENQYNWTNPRYSASSSLLSSCSLARYQEAGGLQMR